MTKLPAGYLDMGRADYEALDIGTLRAIYVEMRNCVDYTMGTIALNVAVRAEKPVTPVDWVVAIMSLTCKCDRCKGSGTYSWGAYINGKMSHSAPCARCGGDGLMTFADMRRGRAYDNHAISRACR